LGLLGESKKELADAVCPFLRNPDPGVRLKAVESVGLIWPPWAPSALSELINDEFPYIRWTASVAAKKLAVG
jgi:HEAT repeat protein